MRGRDSPLVKTCTFGGYEEPTVPLMSRRSKLLSVSLYPPACLCLRALLCPDCPFHLSPPGKPFIPHLRPSSNAPSSKQPSLRPSGRTPPPRNLCPHPYLTPDWGWAHSRCLIQSAPQALWLRASDQPSPTSGQACRVAAHRTPFSLWFFQSSSQP